MSNPGYASLHTYHSGFPYSLWHFVDFKNISRFSFWVEQANRRWISLCLLFFGVQKVFKITFHIHKTWCMFLFYSLSFTVMDENSFRNKFQWAITTAWATMKENMEHISSHGIHICKWEKKGLKTFGRVEFFMVLWY